MATTSDKDRQEDEISALKCIYENEFFCRKTTNKECWISIAPKLPNDILRITWEGQSIYHDVTTKHLPILNLYIKLPENYPSQQPPEYTISITWLTPWQTSLICQKLDDFWQGEEVLFQWLDFLKNELLTFLNITESFDISFLISAFEEPKDAFVCDMLRLKDDRCMNEIPFCHPIVTLFECEKETSYMEFLKEMHTCDICLDNNFGRNMIQIQNCEHVFCKDCLERFVTLKINSRDVVKMACPGTNCNTLLEPYMIKRLCPELYPTYEEFSLKVALDGMRDVIYCPKQSCQNPVIVESSELLAMCNYCDFNFCRLCMKVYHGVSPCRSMTEEEIRKLIIQYNKATPKGIIRLQAKYGKKQLEYLVEKDLTKKYIKENCKLCPECLTPVQKTGGCNKIYCFTCREHFCWICSKLIIDSQNPYSHYDKTSSCYGKLFLGSEEDALQQDEELVLV